SSPPPPPPVLVAQHQPGVRSLLIIGRYKGSSHERPHTEQVKKVSRHHRGLNSLRLLTTQQDERHRMVLGQLLEGLVLFAVVVDLLYREIHVLDASGA